MLPPSSGTSRDRSRDSALHAGKDLAVSPGRFSPPDSSLFAPRGSLRTGIARYHSAASLKRNAARVRTFLPGNFRKNIRNHRSNSSTGDTRTLPHFRISIKYKSPCAKLCAKARVSYLQIPILPLLPCRPRSFPSSKRGIPF